MKLNHSIENNICIVSMNGDFLHDEVPEVKTYMNPLIENESVTVLILDLEKVDYIGSSGIGFIGATFKTLKER